MTDTTNAPRFTTWRGIIQATDAARSAPDRAAKIISDVQVPGEEEDEDRARTAARAVMMDPSKSKSAMTKAGKALTQRNT